MASAAKERDSAIMGGLTLLMLLLWLGFFVHRSPRFAGSLLGHSIGIAGASLMLVPLAYSAIKRVTPLKRLVTPLVPMRTLLAWHIYAGIIGPMLVLLHTGHRFESPLGIALTGMTILVVLSGYVGRYLMRHIGAELRDKRRLLQEAERLYEETRDQLAGAGLASDEVRGQASLWRRVKSAFFVQDLEADAVIATFTDSDFGGSGTDGSGHVLKAEYALAENWVLGGTLFLNEIEENIGNEHDYTRLQLDLEFSF
mgnify:CR=1 FL=1